MDKNVNNNDKAFAVGVSINKLGYPKPKARGNFPTHTHTFKQVRQL